MIPPDEDADFVAAMEQVLEVYQRPEDPALPVVAMDERPVVLHQDLRSPVPGKPGRIARIDSEYKRRGTASAFMFTAPFQGWRWVSIRQRHTAIDWAEEVKYLLDEVYRYAVRVTLVCDNLNTHKIASLSKAFSAEEAQRLSSRLELVHTPKHGSWLNIAEIELSVFSRQCLNRRIPDLQTLRSETQAWQKHRNQTANCVDWQFTTHDARIKLKRLYPTKVWTIRIACVLSFKASSIFLSVLSSVVTHQQKDFKSAKTQSQRGEMSIETWVPSLHSPSGAAFVGFPALYGG